MSVIDSLTTGGTLISSGSLENSQQSNAEKILRAFGNEVKKYARKLQLKASELTIQNCNYVFIAKDLENFHFIFVDKPGSNTIFHTDLSSYGIVDLKSITRQVDIEIGKPLWAFSCMINLINNQNELHNYLSKIASEYANYVTASKESIEKTEESLYIPEIASGLEKFRVDHPKNCRTAFIMMEFGNTDNHDKIFTSIKNALSQYDIKGLRADDKDYMNEIFANIKTYMHGCNFGIAVFERISTEQFNPNVALEVGYMMGLKKEVLLLKDSTLNHLNTDLVGQLYKKFDMQNIETSINTSLTKWLQDKGII